jgi:hypothetical protein
MPTLEIQRDKLLRMLREAEGKWVPLYDILNLGIAQYGARVFELRKLGFLIENKVKQVDGVRYSWFRLKPQDVVVGQNEPQHIDTLVVPE